MKILLCLLIILQCPVMIDAGGDEYLYQKAVRLAKNHQPDFAYMQYRAILNDYPDSTYLSRALFANGEYCYQVADYKAAQDFFTRYLIQADQGENRLFALVYLREIARQENDVQQEAEYKKEVLSYRKQTFLFEKNKAQVYRSPLEHEYKAVYEIDGISVYMEGKLFATINY